MSGAAVLSALDAAAGRFALSGPVGFSTARRLLDEGARLFAAQGAIDIDLAGVTAIDSAGLALVLCWIARARQQGRALSLRNPPAQLAALARISDVEQLLGGTAPR